VPHPLFNARPVSSDQQVLQQVALILSATFASFALAAPVDTPTSVDWDPHQDHDDVNPPFRPQYMPMLIPSL
jgi:hypothetical protein